MRSAKAKAIVTDDLGYEYKVKMIGHFKDEWGDLILVTNSIYITTYECLNPDDTYVDPGEDMLVNRINPYDLEWSLV